MSLPYFTLWLVTKPHSIDCFWMGSSYPIVLPDRGHIYSPVRGRPYVYSGIYGHSRVIPVNLWNLFKSSSNQCLKRKISLSCWSGSRSYCNGLFPCDQPSFKGMLRSTLNPILVTCLYQLHSDLPLRCVYLLVSAGVQFPLYLLVARGSYRGRL